MFLIPNCNALLNNSLVKFDENTTKMKTLILPDTFPTNKNKTTIFENFFSITIKLVEILQ